MKFGIAGGHTRERRHFKMLPKAMDALNFEQESIKVELSKKLDYIWRF